MLDVMRLGHRISRDKRITTHVFLTARALGADKGYLSGEKDDTTLSNIKDISNRWGGNFQVEYVKDWKKFISESESKVVHLTMYGIPVEETIQKIREKQDILVVVGGEKVPAEMYEMADFNVAVTNQPHSEVAALAVFLEKYFEGSELKNDFPNAQQKIIPNERGKSFA
jgi:tRNA (cytidine56-2'-O)-methyltransferase